MGQKRIHLFVRGRVQGVYFRATAQREWDDNTPSDFFNGLIDEVAVFNVALEEDDVKDFLSWAHAGPSTARVDDVEVRWRSYTGEYTDFRITR